MERTAGTVYRAETAEGADDMNMNQIVYGQWIFTDAQIHSASIYLSTSLMSDSLEANTFTADVDCADRSIIDFERNAPLVYSHKGIQVGIFYVQDIVRIGPTTYTISATSAIGLLIEGLHYGGIYSGETVEEILPGICGNVPYEVKTNLRDTALYGWLPVASPRDNLSQVLFAIGATVKTDLNGILRIESLWNGLSGNVGEDKLYRGQSVEYGAKVTQVVVTEHQYTEGSEEAELFTGTTQQGDIITFDEPMHNLVASGFSVTESGANYAIVTAGTGTLTGKKYIHNTRQVTRTVAPYTNSENVKSVTEATLVSLVNSVAVAERLVNYYKCQETINGDIVLDQQATGDVVTTYHPYDLETVQACIESLEINVSNTLRATATQLVGYVPPQFEQIVTYDEHELLTGSGSWTVPDGVTEIRLVLIAGGQAGYNGKRGEDCPAGGGIVYRDDDSKSVTVSAGGTASTNTNATRTANGGSAGQGGEGGEPGIAGNVLQTTIEVVPGASIAYSCGAGGSSNGATGGHTTFGNLTSADGGVLPNGYTDVVTGITYALGGVSGEAGGRGGSNGSEGQSVNGASGGYGYSGDSDDYSRSGTMYYTSTLRLEWNGSVSYSDGGAGGGGAGGRSGSINGSRGGDAVKASWYDYGISGTSAVSNYGACASGSGGAGARGANGATYGSAGSGGGGGGGGGAIGNGSVSAQLSGTFTSSSSGSQRASIESEVSIYPRSGGDGGAGGAGGAGAAGCIIIYYGVAKTVKTGAIIGSDNLIRLDKYGRLMVG